MKTLILMTTGLVVALCGTTTFAAALSQTKPVSKTVTTTKTKPVMTTKTVHKKHVKKSE